MDIAKVTEQYYANNAEKLHKVVDGILKGFGGLSQKDKDDFYSLANEVFWIAVNDFNGKGDFNGFLHSRLALKVRSMITERNRQKRADIEIVKNKDGSIKRIYHQTLSLDAPITTSIEGEVFNLSELVASDFDLEHEVMSLGNIHECGQANVYLDRLSIIQRNIVLCLVDGYKPGEIRECLSISEREYADCMMGIRSYENISVLFE